MLLDHNVFKAVFLINFGLGLTAALAQAPPPGTGTLRLTGYARVIDGDTIETRVNGHLIGIGVIGIRAARGNTLCGELAADLIGRLLQTSGVILEEDPTMVLDGRKRRMYYVTGPDGRSIARDLVRAGLAKAIGRGRETSELVREEQEARRGNRGCINDFPVDKDIRKHLNLGNRYDFLPFPSVGVETTGTDATDTQDTKSGLNIVSAAAAAPRAAVPAGFSQQIVTGGFTQPTGFTFLPDGRILVAEKAGRVRLVKNGVVAATPFIDLRSRVNAYWDHGLLGIAADPNFASNGFVYLLYTYENDAGDYSGSKTQQLIRVKAIGDTASTEPTDTEVILGRNVGESCDLFPAGSDCIPAHSPNHAIGSLRFGSDGLLFASFGDDTTYNIVDDDALRVQDRTKLTGKILRINPATGAGLVTNPFYLDTGDPNANNSKVWALGLRNPFRFGLRPGDNVPLIGDVGWNTWEEIDTGTSGANFGWPCYEGSLRQPGYEFLAGCQTMYSQAIPVQAPAHTYDHNATGASVTGGAVYTGTAYPEQFQRAFYFADYVRGWIRYLKLDSANNFVTSTPSDFATGSGGPVDLQAGPDTNLYYLDINTARLMRIRYTGSNAAPSASASASSRQGLAPLNIQFSSTGSFDADGDSLQYSWDFGDGTAPSSLPNPQHTYAANGTFTATLTVSDGRGETDTTSLLITVGNRAPVATITSPSSSLQFKVGDVISFSGSATDPESGQIPSSALLWQIRLYHCEAGSCHAHPFIQTTGAAGSFKVPDHGGSYYFDLELSATDSGGLTGSSSVHIMPQTALITLVTQPAGLQVIYNGVSGASPMTQASVVGSATTIAVVSPQTSDGVPYNFANWSDGGAQQHTILTGTANATYTATFTASPPTTFTPIRVNAGGASYTDPDGNVWAADTGYSGGKSYAITTAIGNTSTPTIYQSERFNTGLLGYSFAVPNGTYTVRLKFAELWYTSSGKRVFNIGVNGQTVETNFDVFTAAGGAKRAVDRTYTVNVTNSQIAVQFTGVVENPKINAIEILQGAEAVSVSVSPATSTRGPSETQQFTASVTGTSNTAVTWSITPSVGAISTSGLYTAPSTITSQETVTVTATSQADPTKSASATVTLTVPAQPVSVSVSPATSTRGPSETQQFTASVTGTSNTAVTWSITPSVGAISTSGLYTAPSTITSQQTVTVTATSQADPTKSGSATITLMPSATTFTPIRVNAGGASYTDPDGNVWAADTGYSGGRTYAITTAIGNTTTPTIYQSERFNPGSLGYSFAVPNGTYTVRLKFAELWYTSSGKRLFNIGLNGQTVETNFDVFVAAGGAKRAVDRTYTVNVTNNQITLQFTGVVENPKINAIEILEGAPAVTAISPSQTDLTESGSSTDTISPSTTTMGSRAVYICHTLAGVGLYPPVKDVLTSGWANDSAQENPGTVGIEAGRWFPIPVGFRNHSAKGHALLSYFFMRAPMQVIPDQSLISESASASSAATPATETANVVQFASMS